MASSDLPYTDQEMPLKFKLQGRRRLCKAIPRDVDSDDDGDRPQFSGFSDFDSPLKLEEVEKSESQKGAILKDDDNDRPQFAGFSDLDSPLQEKVLEKLDKLNPESRNGAVLRDDDEDDMPKFDGISEFDSCPEEDNKPEKLKFETQNGDILRDNHNNIALKYVENSDFDSPPVLKNVNASDIGGAAEIRNILAELSSKFEGMSIEKKQFDSTGISSSGLFKDGEIDQQKLANFSENASGHAKATMRKISQKSESQVDEDDCMVLSGKGAMKRTITQSSRFNGEPEATERFCLSEDDSVTVDQHSITLSDPKSTYKLPGEIGEMLYPHQRDGLRWLWSLHCQGKGGILGDDMGLGKTMQICGFLAGLFHSNLIKRALIVAPKTLLSHWIKELSIVGLSEKTREYYGTCAKARQYELQYILQDKGILLTTYDIVRNNSKSLRGDFYFDDEKDDDCIIWDYMILDEGHLIKNPSTQRAKSLLGIPCSHRIVISGTPIQNNLKELWALFNFCCPQLLGDKHWFKERYEYAILRGNDKHASDRDKRVGSSIAKELRDRIQPYFLRRLKSDVFQEGNSTDTPKLSKKNEIIVWLKLTGCQRQLYEAFLNSELVLSAFDGSPLAALTILKKICDHPLLLTKRAAEDVLEGMDSLLDEQDKGMAEKLAMHIADVTERENFLEKDDNVSCKISFILSLLDNLISEGHIVLIFSQTRKMLNLIQESLISKGYKFLRIDGTTKASDRVKIVNDFQEGVGAPIFLLTSQVGGLGLTLTKADRVIVVDPAWNPSTDNQSVDRAYRIGQKKDVLVYRLMTCGTVEEKIYRKQIYKGGLFKTATEQKEQTRYFSQQDLKELLSLPKHGFDVSPTQQQLHEEHDGQHIMDYFLTSHIEFLKTQGIAGVSHHSLLFSKTAPTPVAGVEEEEQDIWRKGATVVRKPSSNYSVERNVDGAAYAFNPKNINSQRKNSPVKSSQTLPEWDIKSRISRLTNILNDKVTISKLPDKGEKIRTQLAELSLALERIRYEKNPEVEVIDLDEVACDFERGLNL